MTKLIIYACLALIVSFFCSIAEAVILSVTQPFIESLEKKGKRSGKLLRRLKEDMNRPLTSILTLNTFANTIGAAGVGAQSALVFGNKYIGYASFCLVMGILIFSEIIPKTLGATYWRQLSPVIAPLVHYLSFFMWPFVLLARLLTKGLSHSTNLKGFSREEFAAMADLGAREGQLEAKESRILKNLFRFRSSPISNIMTPRTVVFALQEDMTIEQFFKKYHQTPFTRIPIFKRDRDDITGFVLKDDIILAQARNKNETKLHEFRREISGISANAALSEALEIMLNRREHILLVVDEYGLDGIVTLEDVVETLFGLEIVDEADKTVDMQALARSLWEKRAKRIGLLEKSPGTDVKTDTIRKTIPEDLKKREQELSMNSTGEAQEE